MPLPLPDSLNVPLFPLPGVVLFPGSIVPLRVFEPRYLRMLNDAMAGDQLIALAHLKDPAELAPGELRTEPPPIHDVLGVGRVVAHEPQEDGTINIALLGLGRFRVDEEIPHRPYRIAHVVRLEDRAPQTTELRRHLERSRTELLGVAKTLVGRTLERDAAAKLDAALGEREGAGDLADILAGVYVQHPALKQALLEDLDVLKRTRLLKSVLEKLLAALEPAPPPMTGRYGENDFSLN